MPTAREQRSYLIQTGNWTEGCRYARKGQTRPPERWHPRGHPNIAYTRNDAYKLAIAAARLQTPCTD